ncbi:MAG: rRNA pseudouridine synthase [Lachnospiraceae bacterium]|nr:rRNA pseudouridine synthase [Candidatus Equihabitans merdae]
MRINKYLSERGICSRREADARIEKGRVTICRAGSNVYEKVTPGTKVEEGDIVCLDGKPIGESLKKVYVMLHKPAGIVCTSEKREAMNVIDFVGLGSHLTYVGRLDKESTGLLLLTNDGALNNAMMKAVNGHEKEYVCTVDRAVSDLSLDKMRSGVEIEVPDKNHRLQKVKTRPCKIKRLDKDKFSIILTQGLNRQIRRMCIACGVKVKDLKRVRLLTLQLGRLQEGHWRYLTRQEVEDLRRACGLGE